jgi:four helix bundle protein
MNGYSGFTELKTWKLARKLKNEIWLLIKTFPLEEKYRLCNQIIRASRSIGANIAEGHGRSTAKDELHFCIQARGSISEVLNHLIDAYDCGYIDIVQLKFFKIEIDNVSKSLNGYINFLRKKNEATNKLK